MSQVALVPHDKKYAERLYELTADPKVHEHLAFRNESVEDVVRFIDMVLKEEAEGKTYSRVVLNEQEEMIGVTTLMEIDQSTGTCKLGSWLGFDYWGKGYTQQAKEAILSIAFHDLGLQTVFVGARKANVRSLKAQEKIPYFTIDVEQQYPDIHEKMEKKEKHPCVLNVVYKENFLNR